MPKFDVLLLQSKQLYITVHGLFLQILFIVFYFQKVSARLKVLNFQSSISFLKVDKLEKRKTKVKVWKDVDEVVKATIEIPKKVQWLIEVMEEVPRGEKSKYQASFFYYNHYQSI